MNCPRTRDLYRHPWPGQTAAERDELRAHAQGCPACRATIRRLERATGALREDAVVEDRTEDAATWAAVQARVNRGPAVPWRSFGLVAPLAAAAVAAGLWLRAAPDEQPVERGPARAALDDLPRDRWVRVGAAERVRTPDLDVSLEAGAHWMLTASGLVRLDTGVIEVAGGSRRAPAEVETRQARLQLLGAKATVDATRGTRVEVSRGEVRLTPTSGPPLTLAAPARWQDPPPRAAPEGPPPTQLERPATARGARARPPEARRGRDEAKAAHRAALTRARAILVEDGPEAQRIAERVLERRAEGAEAVDALAVIADVHRRAGAHRRAAAFYARVAEHPAGEAYAEEARLRQARALLAVGDLESALAVVAVAQRRFEGGPLSPERAALQAKVWLRKGDPERAADGLESADPRALSVQAACREVARALDATDPERAARLRARVKK